MSYKHYQERILRLQSLMNKAGAEAMLVTSNVNLLYLFGRIYSGAVYIPAQGEPLYLIRRPHSYEETAQLKYIRKIEELSELVNTISISHIALELDELPYSEIERQRKLFPNASLLNATALLREARMLKTQSEIEQIKAGAQRHIQVYQSIPELYRPGMTDIELQIEIEHTMRLKGSVGIFRTFGSSMEIFMGSLLTGDNASEASPYDFALGGSGSEALPLGSNGTALSQGTSVMIDMAGNFGSYLTDMTRTYSIGELPSEAYRLHELSIRMHKQIMQKAQVGTSCASIYNDCLTLAESEGAKQFFMGVEQQAQFVGHGLGLQINELPVLTGRSKDILQAGMVIAFEPKFVLPQIGAVGIENTYLITEQGVENLTPMPEEIIDLTR